MDRSVVSVMGWGYAGMGWATGLVMLIGVLAFWLAVVLIVRALFSSKPRDDHQLEPLTALEHRYVRGEITRDEFIRMRQDLLNHQPPE